MVVKNPLRPYFLFVGTLRFPWYQKGKKRQAFQYISIIFYISAFCKISSFFISKLGPTFWVHIFFFRRWWKWRKKAPFTTGFCSSLEGSVIWRAFFHLKAGWRTFFPNNILPNIFLPPPSPCIFKDFVLDIYGFFETNTQHIQIQMFLVDMIVVVDPFLALQRDLFFLADGLIVGLTHLARLNLHKAGAGGFEELQAWRTESKHQRNLLAHLRCRGWDVVLPIKNLHLP